MNICARTLIYAAGRRSAGAGARASVIPARSFEVRNLLLYRRKYFKVKTEKQSWFCTRSFFTRWTPIGMLLYGGWLWKRGITEDVSNAEVVCYCHLPLRVVSKIVGKVANWEVPVSARPHIYGKYCSIFNVNMEEADVEDLTKYKNLVTFFTRNLKRDARTVDTTGCLVSPCDGKILSYGPVIGGRVEQVKGVTYSLQQFFGKNTWVGKFLDTENDIEEFERKFGKGGALMEGRKRHKVKDEAEIARLKAVEDEKYYKTLLRDPVNNTLLHCIIYLAPGDYHRFHSPCDWIVKLRRHFSGKLLSVNPIIAKLIPGLFCMNERVVYVGDWRHGFFSYTAVGATNVGSIKIYKDDALKTNGRKKKRFDELVLEPKMDFERGEMIGQFNLGSTIVLVFEAPKNFEFDLQDKEVIKMGEKIGFLKVDNSPNDSPVA